MSYIGPAIIYVINIAGVYTTAKYLTSQLLIWSLLVPNDCNVWVEAVLLIIDINPYRY